MTSRVASNAFPDLLKILPQKAAALRQRQGVWQVLGGGRGRPRTLPAMVSPLIEKLIQVGKLNHCEDGLFRLAGETPRALADASESPWLLVFRNTPGTGEGAVDAALIRAGEKLRHDYEKAHMAARMSARYAPRGGDADRHFSLSDNHVARLADDVFAARQQLHLALEAVGPELSGVLLQICCHAAGLEQAERLLALPRRTGKAILLLGLTRLARHYGFKARLSHAGPGRIGHWAVNDYRPQIMPASAPEPPPHRP